MATLQGNNLVLAISSRALFDLQDSHAIYMADGVEAYRQYQIDHEDEILEPGDAFRLVEKLLSLNASLSQARVEVILVSRNSADTGLRVFNSIQHYGLDITRAAFVGGRSPWRHSAAIFFCRPTPRMYVAPWTPVSRRRPFSPVARGGRPVPSCALPLMVMLCCFPMRPNGCTRAAAWRLFRPASGKQPASRCRADRSNHSLLRSTCYSANSPRLPARFGQRWSPPARRPPMNG